MICLFLHYSRGFSGKQVQKFKNATSCDKKCWYIFVAKRSIFSFLYLSFPRNKDYSGNGISDRKGIAVKYDFETLVDRSRLGSSKYFFMRQAVPEMPEDIVPFSVADMELKNPPEIMAGLREYLQDDNMILGYTIPTMDFAKAVGGWMYRMHGWKVEPQWAVLSPGVLPALFASVKCFTQPGEGVILFSPVYYPFRDSITISGRAVVDVPLVDNHRHYEIDWETFERAAKESQNKLLLLCSPHNPVGRVWTEGELRRLSEICLSNNVLVLSDEIHEDLLMPGYHHTVYAKISKEAEQNCVIYTAPSKTFNLAGLQTAVTFIPNPELRKTFQAFMASNYLRTLTAPGFKACEIAYTQCDEWYRQLLLHIDRNRQVVEDYMAANIPQIIVYPMEGTYLQWWDCRGLGMDYKELEHFMKHEAFVFMDEGYIFGETGKGFERINLACPTKVLVDALDRIRDALEKRK